MPVSDVHVPVSDEQLMAYVDGQLPPEGCAEVEAELARNPERIETVAMFERTGSLPGQAYDHILRERVPPQLIAAVMGGAMPLRRPAWRGRLQLRSPQFMALAAGLAGLALGLGITLALKPPTLTVADIGADGIPAAGALAAALSRTPTGERLTAGGGSFIAPVVTFPRRGGGWCREYRVVGAGGDGAAGLACRQEQSVWRVVAHHPWAGRTPDGAVAPLSGPGPRELDDVADRLQGGNRVSGEAEAALIAGGWLAK